MQIKLLQIYLQAMERTVNAAALEENACIRADKESTSGRLDEAQRTLQR